VGNFCEAEVFAIFAIQRPLAKICSVKIYSCEDLFPQQFFSTSTHVSIAG